MKTTRIVAIALLPLMFAACSVRQLADGSYTTCKVGTDCQVGPRGAAYMAPVRPMHNNKKPMHKHVVVEHDVTVKHKVIKDKKKLVVAPVSDAPTK